MSADIQFSQRLQDLVKASGGEFMPPKGNPVQDFAEVRDITTIFSGSKEQYRPTYEAAVAQADSVMSGQISPGAVRGRVTESAESLGIA